MLSRALRIAARAWAVCGSIAFLHAAFTGRGVAGLVFGWELRRGETIWPFDTYAVLAFVLIVVPLAVLIALAGCAARRMPHEQTPLTPVPPNRIARGAALLGAVCWSLAGLAFTRALAVPPFDAPPVEVVLDEGQDDARLAEGKSIVLGVARFDRAIRYVEGTSGKTSFRLREHHFVPLTPPGWRENEPIRIVSDAFPLNVRDLATGRFRPERGDERVSAIRAAGMLLRAHVPPFISSAFARQGLLLAPDVLVLTTDRGAGRDGWYEGAALLGFAGLLAVVVAVTAAVAWWKQSRHR